MKINKSKCECIHYSTNNPETVYLIGVHQIPSVKTVGDLGILIDNKLTFNPHIDALRTMCCKYINFIFRLLSIKQANPYIHLYKLSVLLRVLFASQIYGSGSSLALKNLESIQKYFTRKIFYRWNLQGSKPNYSQRLNLFFLRSLRTSILFEDILTLYKIMRRQLSFSLQINFSKKNLARIVLSPVCSRLYGMSFYHRAMVAWNKLKLNRLPNSPLDISPHLSLPLLKIY